MTTALADRAQTVCRAAFVVTLLIFLALATILVGTQVVGVLFLQASWVSWAADALLVPSITAGVVFGLVGFVGGYLMPKDQDEAQE
ncbi:hypothetical protein [Prauserella cavernicola]|uniref:Uncharacterized protein n=1 Tax=Prauserella cavernicola TaxID=2800127 RepID=A0A934QQ52_9PSEU|nr:hypothetical protein [Prauserella cavernicola]MBK1783679.1 hypothetical protein [Prauserella cavernicola]